MENKIEVYKAISRVQGELAKDGIGKDQTNKMQGFKYRGIDDVYCALAPILAECKLCILPRMMSKEVVERPSKQGGVLFYTTINAEFDLVSAFDGSKHTVSSYGEAMDSGDKSIGKAMSYAYKAMAFMTFSIPTDGENDPDAKTYEVANTVQPVVTQTPRTLSNIPVDLGTCKDCGTKNIWSTNKNKPYCSAKCWLNEPLPIEPPKEVQVEDEILLEDIPF